MIVFALYLHICTMTESRTPLGTFSDSSVTSCGWERGDFGLFSTEALCTSEGKRQMAGGSWGDDIADVRHSADRFQCRTLGVVTK